MSRSVWWVLMVPLLWGSMPAAAAAGFPSGHPLLIATVRSLGAGLGILLVFRCLPPIAWRMRIIALGAINIALTFGLFFISSARIGALITLFMALAPFWATLLGRAMLGETIRPIRILLILSGISGVALLICATPVHLDPAGLLAGAGASFCMGWGIVLFKKWGRPAPLIIFTGWQLVAGGILLAGVLACGVETLPANIDLKGMAALLYLVTGSTVLAYTLWFRGIERLGAQQTSMLLLMVPVVGLGLDAALLDKHLLSLQYFGGLLVIGSLLLDVMQGRRKCPPSIPEQANQSKQPEQ